MPIKLILKEQSGSRSITFPVTPPGFTVGFGQVVQTVHVHEVGDVTLAGQPKLGSFKLSVLLPKQGYSFAAADRAPYEYIEQLQRWVARKKALRYIITGTPINLEVLLESVDYGEQDGTGDVYADIVLRETVELDAPETVRPRGSAKPRTGSTYTSSTGILQHTVVKGDCMSSIALRYYGNGGKAYYEALARYNNRSAYAFIYPREVLLIPSREALGVK